MLFRPKLVKHGNKIGIGRIRIIVLFYVLSVLGISLLSKVSAPFWVSYFQFLQSPFSNGYQ